MNGSDQHSDTKILPSWKEGSFREAVLSYTQAVTDEKNGDFIPVEDRVASFDMDGTIFCEKPLWLEMAIARERLAEIASQSEIMRDLQPFKAAVEGDDDFLRANFILTQTTAFRGCTQDYYYSHVQDFMKNRANSEARHEDGSPVLFKNCFFKPMIELIQYLESLDFKVYIVSGSEQCMVRSACRFRLGLDFANMIGSLLSLTVEYEKDKVSFIREGSYLAPADVGDGKPESLHYRIGKTPVFSFGNTRDDIGMLTMASSSPYRSMQCLLVHDDGEREFNYVDDFLKDYAEARGWHNVSMKDNFAEIFENL